MIEFEKISYKNFLSTGNVPVELDLNKYQSSLFVGNNGSGKSTILDALNFALFGTAFRKINRPQLINSTNNKHMLVELWFKANNSSYRIVRGMKPNLFEIYENDILINQPAIIYEYQETLEKKIIKMNQKAFQQIVVLGSRAFVPFMMLTAAARREVIEDILDIKIFSTMFSLLKNKIQENRDELQDNEHQIELAEQKLNMHTKHIESLKQNNEAIINSKLDKKLEHDEEIAKHKQQAFCIDLEISAEESTIKDQKSVEEDWVKHCGWDEKLTEKLLSLSKDIEFLEKNNNCPTCKQDIQEIFKNNNLNEKKKKAEETQVALAKLHVKLQSIDDRRQKIDDICKVIKEKQKLIDAHKQEYQLYEQFNQHIDDEITSLRTQTEQVSVDEEETLKIKSELMSKHQHKEELIINKQVLEIAASILKDGGIKSVLIKQYIPIMNKLINKHLNSLDANYGFELDDNFNETIKSRYRDEFTYNSFSEGQKLRIDVALLFTWREIAKLRNSAATNLLIMDEILDSSLDYAGTEEFLKLLQVMAKDTNTIIISHKIDQLTDKFDNVLKFEIVKNFTKMSKGEILV